MMSGSGESAARSGRDEFGFDLRDELDDGVDDLGEDDEFDDEDDELDDEDDEFEDELIDLDDEYDDTDEEDRPHPGHRYDD